MGKQVELLLSMAHLFATQTLAREDRMEREEKGRKGERGKESEGGERDEKVVLPWP